MKPTIYQSHLGYQRPRSCLPEASLCLFVEFFLSLMLVHKPLTA